jgi:hypothetical protein
MGTSHLAPLSGAYRTGASGGFAPHPSICGIACGHPKIADDHMQSHRWMDAVVCNLGMTTFMRSQLCRSMRGRTSRTRYSYFTSG